MQQIVEMSDGIFLVPVFREVSNTGISMVNKNETGTKKSIHNDAIISAFEDHWQLGQVLYFYHDQWLEVMQGNYLELLMDKNLKPVPVDVFTEDSYFMVSFEPAGWAKREEGIVTEKSSMEDLKSGNESYRIELPLFIPEDKKMTVPIYRTEARHKNEKEDVLLEANKLKNKQLIEALNEDPRSAEFLYFYVEDWEEIENNKLKGNLLDSNFETVSTDSLTSDSLYFFSPRFAATPPSTGNESSFNYELSLMNPGSNQHPALVVERMYDKLTPRNQRKTYRINFQFSYRLNQSIDVQKRYDVAVKGLMDIFEEKMIKTGIIPDPSEAKKN